MEAVVDTEILVYTDGACAGNPGPGGWGVLVIAGAERHERSGGFRRTTNNRMELLSVIAALEAVAQQAGTVRIRSDSRYVVDMLNGGHAARWRRNSWMRDKKHAALNSDLWGRLLDLCGTRSVVFEWVRGHDGQPENERVDALAVAARELPGLPPDEGYENPPLFVAGGLFG